MKENYDFSNAKRGPIAPTKGKTRITIMLDDAVLEAAREKADEQGMGYQTLINTILREKLLAEESPNPEFKILRDQIELLQKQMTIVVTSMERDFKALHITRGKTGLFKHVHIKPRVACISIENTHGKAVASKSLDAEIKIIER